MSCRKFLKIFGSATLALALAACGIKPTYTPTVGPEGTATAPRVTDVATATEAETAIPPTATSTETATATSTETPMPTGVYSGVYTYTDFETKDITFQDLPFIDYQTLKTDDLSDVEVVGDPMENAKAVATNSWLNGVGPDFCFMEIQLFEPNYSSYVKNPDTRPFDVVRAFRTTVNGKDFPGAIVLVKNTDGSTSKLKVLFPSFFAQPGNRKYLNEQLKNGPATNWAIISFAHVSRSVIGDLEYGLPHVSYTDYEVPSTPAELEVIKKLMLQWQQTGKAPPDLSKYDLEADFGLW